MKIIDYHTLSIGEKFTSKFIITEELIKDYVDALADPHKPGKVPNYLFLNFAPIYEAFDGRLSPGTLQIKQKIEFYQEALVGDEINVTATIKGKYRKNERDYFIYEVDFLKDNELVCKHVSTHLWDFLSK